MCVHVVHALCLHASGLLDIKVMLPYFVDILFTNVEGVWGGGWECPWLRQEQQQLPCMQLLLPML